MSLTALAREYNSFRDGLEKTDPEKFTRSREILAACETTMDEIDIIAGSFDFDLDRCDLAFNTEASLFDYFRRSNPAFESEIAQVIALSYQVSA